VLFETNSATFLQLLKKFKGLNILSTANKTQDKIIDVF